MNKRFFCILKWAVIILSTVVLLLALLLIFKRELFYTLFKLTENNKASEFGDLFGGFIGALFAFLSFITIIYTIVSQNLETAKAALRENFYKMLEYHNLNVSQLQVPSIDKNKTHLEKARRAFVAYKIQINCLQYVVAKLNNERKLDLGELDITGVVYTLFYYGLEETWEEFTEDKLSNYPVPDDFTDILLKEFNKRKEYALGRTNQTNLSTYFENMF